MKKFYSVVYEGINIYKYKMTSEEELIVESFRKELINICNSLNIERGKCFDGSPYMGRLKESEDFTLKYEANIGYYVLDGERGLFRLRKGFPTKDKEEAKFNLLKSEFESSGHTYEANNRDIFEKEWLTKSNNRYDSRKIAFEYVMKMLNKCFDNLPERTITEYTNYMNIRLDKKHWQFNIKIMEFEEI